MNTKSLIPKLIAFFFFISLSTIAQRGPVIIENHGKQVTIRSKILNEERPIQIYIPADSSRTGEAFPVIYVLDGENHFNLMVEYSKQLSRWDVDVAPPLVVVGIPNTDRNRDLTPSHSIVDFSGKIDTSSNSWLKKTGGNEKLFQFLQQELMPYINANYRTQPYRILAGHSFGGITVLNCLIQHPEMFEAYIAVSPSLAWDEHFILKLAEERLREGISLNKTLLITDGNEGVFYQSQFHRDVLELDSLIHKRNIKGLNYKYVHYPLENHGTVPNTSYHEGLRFIYRDWELPQIKDEDLNAAFAVKRYQALSQKYGYKILPQEATVNDWAQYLLTSPATVKNGIGLLEMNVSNYPESSKALEALAVAYHAQGEKKKALAIYKKVRLVKGSSREIEDRIKELDK